MKEAINVDNKEVEVSTSEKKEWKDMSLAEQRESIKNQLSFEINKSIREGYSPLLKKQSKEQINDISNIAYNGFSGNAYTGLNAILLDTKKAEHNYPSNTWLSAKQALALGVNLGEKFNRLNNIPKVRLTYIQTLEVVPKYERDKEGNPIPLLDENGNQRVSKNGVKMYKREVERDEEGNPIPITSKDGEVVKNQSGETLYKFATETKELEKPIVGSIDVYNIRELIPLGLKLEKLSPLMTKDKDGNTIKLTHPTSHIDKNNNVITNYSTQSKGFEEFAKKAVVLTELKKDFMQNKKYGLSDKVISSINSYCYAKSQNADFTNVIEAVSKVNENAIDKNAEINNSIKQYLNATYEGSKQEIKEVAKPTPAKEQTQTKSKENSKQSSKKAKDKGMEL